MAEETVKLFGNKSENNGGIVIVSKGVSTESLSSLNSAAFGKNPPPQQTPATAMDNLKSGGGGGNNGVSCSHNSSNNLNSAPSPIPCINNTNNNCSSHHNNNNSPNNYNWNLKRIPTWKEDKQNVLSQVEPIWVKHSNEINQNNLCNGAISSSAMVNQTNSSSSNTNLMLARKVHNHSPNGGLKRPMVALTHLPKRPPVDIEFTDISYSVPEGKLKTSFKTILKSVNGKFKSGLLTAIMGPSGAGKSTLMNILAGYKTSHLSGTVSINGKERNLRRFRKLSCYIMQDDRLLPYITVQESMMISANLKLGKDITTDTKRMVVEEIIDALGLSEAKNTMTVCLSGGQRKRLSIALELVNNPPVMFFDEPTSGLDSSSCFQLITLLKSLARGGRTVVCTIHQPSARLFEMFDHLYMLAEGQAIYMGQVQGLVPFLSGLGFDCPSYHNPADYVMEVACGEYGESVHKLVMAVNTGKCNNYNVELEKTNFESSGSNSNNNNTNKTSQSINNDIAKTTTTTTLKTTTSSSCASANVQETSLCKQEFTAIAIPEKGNGSGGLGKQHNATCTTSLLDSNESVVALTSSKKVGFPTSSWVQIWILLKRTFLTIMRDQQLTHMRLLAHIIVGTIIGMIYYDIGNDASKVMSNAGCIFFTTVFTMFTAMMPTILTFPTEMAVFVREHLNYWYSLKAFYFAKTVADLPFQILFASVYVVVVYYLTSQPMEWARMSMFVFICLLTSLVAQSLGLLIGAGLSVELGVFLGPVSTIPTMLFSGFFANLSAIPGYLQWVAYISYIRYGFEGAMISVYGMDRERLECNEIYCHFRSPKKFLEEMAMDKAQYWINAVVLIGMFLALRVVAYFVLRWKIHSIR